MSTHFQSMALCVVVAGAATACSIGGPVWLGCRYERSELVPPDEALFDQLTEDHIGRFVARPVWLPHEGRVPDPGIIDALYFEFSSPDRRAVERLTIPTEGSEGWCPAERANVWLHVDVSGQDPRFSGATDVPIRFSEDATAGRASATGKISIHSVPSSFESAVPEARDGSEATGFALDTLVPTTLVGLLQDPTPHQTQIGLLIEETDTTTNSVSHSLMFQGYIAGYEPLPATGAP